MAWPILTLEPHAMNERPGGGCWICNGRNALEWHHIIPRAYGGTDWAQVLICGVCHAGVHKVAEQGDASVQTHFSNLSREGLTSVLTCARVIRTAKGKVQDDPNKQISFSDTFPAQTSRQLRELASATKQPQWRVVRTAIADLHARLIGKGK